MYTGSTSEFQIYNDNNNRRSYNPFIADSFGSQSSLMTSDSDETYDKYEEELFNNGNPFKSPTTPITPLTPINNKNVFNINGDTTINERFMKRPSLRMLHDENSNITKSPINRITSSYNNKNKNSPIKSSKTSISSLYDITNISSARSSIRNNNSNSNLRSYSLHKNDSTLSIEQKKKKIIRNLNKRNSKNLKNPYFYQYDKVENKQPNQKLPILPTTPIEDNVNNKDLQTQQRIVDLSETSSFSEISSNLLMHDDSLHFVDDKVIIQNSFSGFSGRNTNVNPGKNHKNQNSNNHENNNNNNNDNFEKDHDENNGNTTGNDAGEPSDDSNNTQEDKTNNNNNTTNSGSTDTTESSDSLKDVNNTNRNSTASVIKQAQRSSLGLFVEFSPTKSLSFTGLNNRKSYIEKNKSFQNSTSRRDSEITVATEKLNFEKIDPNERISSINISQIKASTELSLDSIPDENDDIEDAIITIKNINEHDGNKESSDGDKESSDNDYNEPKFKKFNLNNDSTVSSVHTPNETVSLPVKTLKQKRKPVPLPLSNATPKIPALDIDLSEEENLIGYTSQGSREELLNNKKKVHINDNENHSYNSEYDEKYYESNYRTKCSDSIAILLIILSIIAPPFWLMIFMGKLDSTFGKFNKTQKIISLTMFIIFTIGAIIGIAVGFGYGLTHK